MKIAIGSDVGGSLRGPAHFCGICAFKPTPMRMSKKGCAVPRVGERNGQEAILSTPGPLARSVADCVTVMRVFWAADSKMFARDPLCVPMPFDELKFSRPARVRIGWSVHSIRQPISEK